MSELKNKLLEAQTLLTAGKLEEGLDKVNEAIGIINEEEISYSFKQKLKRY
ncbi:MAG: hypothetical protein ACTSXD_08450 [Candidatus Heimdallarchaeaceae archaeon]